MVIMQGDSYPIPIEITQDGQTLTPEMVDDIEITVGSDVVKTLSDGDLIYENGTWYMRLSQQETLDMSAGSYAVIGRVKYPGEPANVVGRRAGIITVTDANSKEVL